MKLLITDVMPYSCCETIGEITDNLNRAVLSYSVSVCVAVGRVGCTIGTSHCRDPTAAALIQPAIKRRAEVNLFPLRSAQYTIDLGGSTGRQIYALISNSLHLIGTW